MCKPNETKNIVYKFSFVFWARGTKPFERILECMAETFSFKPTKLNLSESVVSVLRRLVLGLQTYDH